MPDLLAAGADGRPAVREPGAVVVAAPRRRLERPRGDGRTAVRGGYGLYFNTNNQQNLIVTVTNPPATPRVVIANPTFPVPPFERGTGISVRPIQYDVQYPRVHMWNVNVQQEFWSDWGVTIGVAGSRGQAPVAQFRSERPDAGDATGRHAVLSAAGLPAQHQLSRRSK